MAKQYRKGRLYTGGDDELVLNFALTDEEVAEKIGRSERAIKDRRTALRKKSDQLQPNADTLSSWIDESTRPTHKNGSVSSAPKAQLLKLPTAKYKLSHQLWFEDGRFSNNNRLFCHSSETQLAANQSPRLFLTHEEVAANGNVVDNACDLQGQLRQSLHAPPQSPQPPQPPQHAPSSPCAGLAI